MLARSSADNRWFSSASAAAAPAARTSCGSSASEGVVCDRRDPLAVELDLRPRARLQYHGPAARVDEAARFRKPIGQRERRVAEGIGQHRA
jgi:hypothetical protein